MRMASKICLLLALLLTSFGIWGMHSASGRRTFDEMDGLIPFGALILGVLTLGCAAILVIAQRRARPGGQ